MVCQWKSKWCLCSLLLKVWCQLAALLTFFLLRLPPLLEGCSTASHSVILNRRPVCNHPTTFKHSNSGMGSAAVLAADARLRQELSSPWPSLTFCSSCTWSCPHNASSNSVLWSLGQLQLSYINIMSFASRLLKKVGGQRDHDPNSAPQSVYYPPPPMSPYQQLTAAQVAPPPPRHNVAPVMSSPPPLPSRQQSSPQQFTSMVPHASQPLQSMIR